MKFTIERDILFPDGFHYVPTQESKGRCRIQILSDNRIWPVEVTAED